MTTDFRALCAELTEYLALLDEPPGELVVRASAALAEPEPENPADEEIMKLMPQQMRDDLAAAARAMAGFDPDNIKAASVFRIILNRHAVDHCRAVLARWGNHPAIPDSSPLPIPASERLPEEGDRNNEGECWWLYLGDDECCSFWTLFDGRFRAGYTHWLPYYALPCPLSQHH